MKKIKAGIVCLAFSLSISAAYAAPNNQNDNDIKNLIDSIIKRDTASSKGVAKKTKSIKREDIFNSIIQESQSQIPYFKKQYAGNFLKDITITGKSDHTIVYTYTLAQSNIAILDVQAMKPFIIKTFKSSIDSIKTIIPDVKFQMVILKPNGSELGNIIITQTDIDNIDAKSSNTTQSKIDFNNINDRFNLLIGSARTQLPALKQQMENVFTDVNITGNPNHTMVYTYVFRSSMPATDKKVSRIIWVKRFKSTFDRMKILIPDIKVKVVYLNPNGSVWDKFIITKDNIDTLSQLNQ